MILRPALLIAVSLLLVASPARADVAFRGLAYSRLNLDLRQDNPYEDNLEWHNKVFFQVKADRDEDTQAVFSVLGEHNTYSGRTTRLEYDLSLYEGYVRLRRRNWSFYLGKQLVDWSQSDVSVLDSINPRDLTEFVTREDEFIKIPTLMARAVYTGENDSWEFLYEPFYTPSKLRLYGTDWSLLSNKAVGEYQGQIDTNTFMQQGYKPGIDDYPAYNGVNGSLAARWVHHGDQFDYQLQAFNGWAVLPLFDFNKDFAKYLAAQPEGARRTLETLSPQEVIAYSPLYKSRPARQTQLGAGLSGAVGESTVRAEVAVVEPQQLYTNNFELTEHTVVSATAGIDRFFFGGKVYGNLAYVGAFVGQYPAEGLYLAKQFNHFAVGVLRGSFFDDQFTPEARAILQIPQADYMLNVRLPLRVSDNTQVAAGVYYFDGPGESIFGQFRENSFFYTQLRYAF